MPVIPSIEKVAHDVGEELLRRGELDRLDGVGVWVEMHGQPKFGSIDGSGQVTGIAEHASEPDGSVVSATDVDGSEFGPTRGRLYLGVDVQGDFTRVVRGLAYVVDDWLNDADVLALRAVDGDVSVPAGVA